MNRVYDLISKVFEYLNSNINYAVLRNYQKLPLENTSRDIDILVEKSQFMKRETEFYYLIVTSGFNITTLYKSDKIFTYVCASISNDEIELVQFDFFFNTSVFGFLLLDAKSVLKLREYNGAIYHVSSEYEFLDKYLQMKLLNVEYPEKYFFLKTKVRQSDLLTNILKEIVCCSSLNDLDKLSTGVFKFRVLFQNFKKRPWMQILSFYFFIATYLKNYFFYKGYSIGLTGADGSGKTTIINATVSTLQKTYPSIKFFHFRPSFLANLGEAAFKLKLISDVDRNYSIPHRSKKTGKLNSLVRLLYYSLDYIIGYFLRVRPYLCKRSIVIFDRYYTDIIADSRRSRIFLNHKFLYWFGKLFIPALDYNILLTADRDIILSRKQEIDKEGIDQINAKMNFLSKKKGYCLVINNGTPEEAVQRILAYVFEGQHLKNIKRIMKA